MALDVGIYTDGIRHRADRAARWTGGFALRQALNILSGGGSIRLATLTQQSGGNLANAFIINPAAYSFGMVSLGLGVGIRAYLNHREMEYHKKELTQFYKREIGACLSKSPEQVTTLDLEVVASQIPTLDAELKRKRKEMHLSTFAWGIGAVVSLLAIIGAVALLPATATFVAVAVGLGVGYVTHTTTQDIVETIGAKAIGSMEQNPLDRIHSLERQQQLGRKITPEQVMSVYVATDPQLDMKIRRDPEFGKPFDRLPLAQKHKAILTHGKDLGIQEVTDSINQNRFSARELAFSVCGERSGAYAEPTLYQEMQGKLSSLKQGLDKGRLVAAQKWDGMVSRISSPKQEETVEAVAPAKEWVKDLGLQPPAAVDEQIGGWVAKREAELAARHTPSSQQIH